MDRRISDRRAADTADRLAAAVDAYQAERRAHERRKALSERRESARICHWIARFDAARQERAAQ